MTNVVQIEVSRITPGKNDRKKFTPEAINGLAESIQSVGRLLQPIVLRPLDDGGYRIVAGERRFRACSQVLGWATVPAIVLDLSREAESAAMLAENKARVDLNPIEEANAYKERMDEFGWDVEACARAAGVTAHIVRARLALLNLRDDIQPLVGNGNFTVGFAEILGRSGLDANFQGQALRHLQENRSPSLPWFRRVVGELVATQSQGSLFGDGPLFGGLPVEPVVQAVVSTPPHPSSTIPPHFGGSPTERCLAHAGFWRRAAEEWAAVGNGDKKRDCLAAAAALDTFRLTL